MRNGYTATQLVQDAQMQFLRNKIKELDTYNNFNGGALTATEVTKAVRAAIVSQHNKLLNKSGLDGTELE
jgi:hypothetical protein